MSLFYLILQQYMSLYFVKSGYCCKRLRPSKHGCWFQFFYIEAVLGCTQIFYGIEILNVTQGKLHVTWKQNASLILRTLIFSFVQKLMHSCRENSVHLKIIARGVLFPGGM